MKLRLRLAVVTLGVTLPMIAGIVWLDLRARQVAAEEELAEMALMGIGNADERERCERSPATWGRRGPGGPRPPPPPPPNGPRPPPRREIGTHRHPAAFFAYDDELRSQNPDAPDLSAQLAAIAGRSAISLSTAWNSSRAEVLVRTSWEPGPCAFVLARGTTEPWLGGILPPTRIWLAPLLVVFAAVLLAIGPVVQRIRRLTEAVRRSAAAGYEGDVLVALVSGGGRDEIAELAGAFDAAGREVRAQLGEKDRRDRALRHFLSDTTHDVMIPLTVLQGHLATLEERASAGEPADSAVLTSAMNEAHYMGALMHNLAVAAKLDAEKPQLQRGAVDLNALVARVLGRHRPIARQRQVSVEIAVPEEPLVTDADVTLLEQAVSNLVYNAVRYNHPGGHVAVILEPLDPDRFRLRVVDDGPGIAAAELSRLAERGYRGNEARTRSPDGQGLGLSIVQRVADLHDLRLQFQPSEYGGLQVDLEGAIGYAHGESHPAPR